MTRKSSSVVGAGVTGEQLAAAMGSTAVAGALGVKSTPGQVLSDRAFDDAGNPIQRKPVKVTKGTAKVPEVPSKPVTGTGKAKAGRSGKADEKPATAAPVSVSAAKPVKLGERAAKAADPGLTAGYDLTHWAQHSPQLQAVLPPSEADILAARALHKGRICSLNELSIACNLGLVSRQIPALDMGFAIGPVMNAGVDIAINATRTVIDLGLLKLVDPDTGEFLPGERPHPAKRQSLIRGNMIASYCVRPTAAGLALIEAALSARGLAVPEYMRMSNAEIAASGEAAKAAKAKARADKKAAKQPAAAAKVKGHVKRK